MSFLRRAIVARALQLSSCIARAKKNQPAVAQRLVQRRDTLEAAGRRIA
jgi:hypothetical protein